MTHPQKPIESEPKLMKFYFNSHEPIEVTEEYGKKISELARQECDDHYGLDSQEGIGFCDGFILGSILHESETKMLCEGIENIIDMHTVKSAFPDNPGYPDPHAKLLIKLLEAHRASRENKET